MTKPGFAEQLAVIEVKPDVYASKHNPRPMGNAAPIAYGGNTMGVMVSAAYQTVPPTMHVYSLLGSFHGPARIDRQLLCRVERTRQTKSFATRRVVTYQVQDDQSERVCADFFMDFHVDEAGIFEYDAVPSRQYLTSPEDPAATATPIAALQRQVANGTISQATMDAQRKFFSMNDEFFHVRHSTAGVSGQNLNGLLKGLTTTQDHLPIYEKSSAEWCKARQPLHTEAEHVAALAFWMDAALSFLPLNFDHKGFDDAGACSTLDVALRVLTPHVRLDEWHLKERRTIAAHVSRTYSEARLWDLSGRMVAVMTQTSICRPPRSAAKSQPKL